MAMTILVNHLHNGGIYLDKTNLSLTKGINYNLTVQFLELPQSLKITWSSSNDNVATVENGKVIAKNVGTATITAITQNQDGEYKATCNVTVLDKSSSNKPNNEIKNDNSPLNLKDKHNETTKDSNNTIHSSKYDNTIASGILPKTGIGNFILLLSVIIMLSVILTYIRYNNLKDI